MSEVHGVQDPSQHFCRSRAEEPDSPELQFFGDVQLPLYTSIIFHLLIRNHGVEAGLLLELNLLGDSLFTRPDLQHLTATRLPHGCDMDRPCSASQTEGFSKHLKVLELILKGATISLFLVPASSKVTDVDLVTEPRSPKHQGRSH